MWLNLAGFIKQNDPLDSPMLRLEFQNTKTGTRVKMPLFFMTWYDFDSDAKRNAVESVCIERDQFDATQSTFTVSEYMGYHEVKASDTETIKNYLKEAFPERDMLSADKLAKLGQRLDNTACFVGACTMRPWPESVLVRNGDVFCNNIFGRQNMMYELLSQRFAHIIMFCSPKDGVPV